MKDLEGKVAVVTGAASGIGRGLARRWAAAGMKLVLADIEADPLGEVATELADGGTEVLHVPADVSDAAAVDSLAERTYERFGAAHIVCNNAGVGGGGTMWELTDEDWQWVLGVNLWGVIHGVRAFVPGMIDQGEGHVVNTASIAGLTSAPMLGPYNVSKHGVVTLSEGLDAELKLHGHDVGVTVVCPGWVNTRIFEADRNRPEHLAETGTAEIPDEMREQMAQVIAGGIDPGEVAARVEQAVRGDELYVLTHDDWNEMVVDRARRIIDAAGPEDGAAG